MASARKSYEMDMCSGPILPKMLRFALPLMFSSLLQLLFNAADIIVVGRFAGDNSMAAVGSTAYLINLFVNLFIGISVGANILASRLYGAQDKEGLHQTVHTAMFFSLISGIFLAIFGFFSARYLLILMKSPAEVIDLATLYLRIYFLGMPATMLYNFGAALLRAVGDTQRALYYLLFAGVVNVLLNLVLVIVFQMDVAGVAIATVVSHCISAALVVRCLVKEANAVHLDLHQLRIHQLRLRQILQVGLPAGLQSVVFALSNVVIQSAVNSFGEVVVAGNSASHNMEQFIYVCMNTFYQAVISFVSQNLGGGNYHRIRRSTLTGLACVLTIGIPLAFLARTFSAQLIGIYSDSFDVIAAGVNRANIMLLLYVVAGMMEVMAGAVRGIGYSMLPMFVSLVGVCGLRLLWIATVFQIPAFHSISTVYWSYPMSWSLTLIAHTVCFIWGMKKLKQRLLTQ